LPCVVARFAETDRDRRRKRLVTTGGRVRKETPPVRTFVVVFVIVFFIAHCWLRLAVLFGVGEGELFFQRRVTRKALRLGQAVRFVPIAVFLEARDERRIATRADRLGHAMLGAPIG
jgi:hypothetical protein